MISNPCKAAGLPTAWQGKGEEAAVKGRARGSPWEAIGGAYRRGVGRQTPHAVRRQAGRQGGRRIQDPGERGRSSHHRHMRAPGPCGSLEVNARLTHARGRGGWLTGAAPSLPSTKATGVHGYSRRRTSGMELRNELRGSGGSFIHTRARAHTLTPYGVHRNPRRLNLRTERVSEREEYSLCMQKTKQKNKPATHAALCIPPNRVRPHSLLQHTSKPTSDFFPRLCSPSASLSEILPRLR